MRIVALLTCHNRRDMTVRCLEGFFSQVFPGSAPDLAAVVVDDGSSDGTREAVSRFVSVHTIRGDGTLHWARGMQLAEREATSTRPDFLLWLNDDVELEATGAAGLLDVTRECPDAIVVGALLDRGSGVVTYSGVRLSRWHPLRASLVDPRGGTRDAQTFNGNVVLVPRPVYESVGPIDGSFSHGQADFDYGLRARQAGFRIIVAPEPVGYCGRGDSAGTFADTTLPLSRRWQLVQSPKGLPMRSHARYLRRHGGPLWPLFWIAPYAKLTLSALATAPRRMRSQE